MSKYIYYYDLVCFSISSLCSLQYSGDTVMLKGKKRTDTVLIALADDACEDTKIRLNKGISRNHCPKLFLCEYMLIFLFQ